MLLYLIIILATLLQFGKTQNQCVREIRALKGDIQEEVRREVEDKATKEDVHQRAVEVVNTLNNSVAIGNRQIVNTLQQIVEAKEENKTSGEQCVTRDELQAVQRDIQLLTSLVAEIKSNTANLLAGSTNPRYTCNGTPGWRQVVFINMTDTSYNCPPGLNLTSYSKRTCGRAHTYGRDCSSTIFSVGGSEYSQVCGRIRGYQVGSDCGFWQGHSQTIDSYYVDGVSLTHGPVGGRKHIWSFAIGLTEITYSAAHCQCPCDNIGASPPSFVGNDYFCESGQHLAWDSTYNGVPFLDDPLWDGENCTSTSTCCQLNNPPWFTKTLPNPITDDIELRLCNIYGAHRANTALEIIEIYVQ